jgi:23S rRNA methylase
MAKSSKSTKWIKSHRNDHFVKKALKENYLSRAALNGLRLMKSINP